MTKITIQQGIDAHDLSQAIYETIRAGAEAEVRDRQKLHEARMELIRKSGGSFPAPQAEQGSLF